MADTRDQRTGQFPVHEDIGAGRAPGVHTLPQDSAGRIAVRADERRARRSRDRQKENAELGPVVDAAVELGLPAHRAAAAWQRTRTFLNLSERDWLAFSPETGGQKTQDPVDEARVRLRIMVRLHQI